MIEGLVVRIDGDLSDDGAHRTVDAALQKLGAQCVLEIIADIALAHRGADGHRRAVGLMEFGKFIHSGVDHADLRSIAVCDNQLCAFFDKISQNGSGRADCRLLFRKCSTERPVTECNNNSLFHKIVPLTFCLLAT